MMQPKWIRTRFEANLDDSRPIKWPPPGPFWESGFNDQHAIVIAYVKTYDQIQEFWPEAENIEIEPRDEIIFSDRFPEPDWWNKCQT